MKDKFDIFIEVFFERYKNEFTSVDEPIKILGMYSMLKAVDNTYERMLLKEGQDKGYVHTPPPIENKPLFLYFIVGVPIMGTEVRNTKLPAAIVAAKDFTESRKLVEELFVSTNITMIGTTADCSEPHILYKFNIQQ